MEVIVSRGCGLDVHQATVVACLLVGEPGTAPRKQVKTFSTWGLTTDPLWLAYAWEQIRRNRGAQFRGWRNYYRYATSPQKAFSRLASETWWAYAHYLARKHRCSIRRLLQGKTQAGGYEAVAAKGRRRKTFRLRIGDRDIFLDILAPKTASIHQVSCHQNWTVDLMPLKPTNWQSGRSLATRLAALDRANGVCERCHENPAVKVHHIAPRSESFAPSRCQRRTSR
jgi:Group II intron, maturase-specific domain